MEGTIFTLIKGLCELSDRRADIVSVEKRVLARGFTLDNLEKTLQDYQNLNLLMVSNGYVTLLD
jgi:hypothetical protein